MSLFAALATDKSISTEKDSVGGSRESLASGLYPCTISMAHVTTSAGGAMGLVLTLKTETGSEIKQTLWMTSGTAKGGKNYYEKDGQKNYLPGFNHANSLCQLSVGKEISEIEPETKVLSLYNFEAKAEVPTKVPVLMELLGKEILVGLIKQTVDKTAKNDSNVYVPTGDTKEENEIDKFFRAEDRMTTAEILAKAAEASFVNAWDQKNTGKTRNKAKGDAGTAGAPRNSGTTAPAASKKPATSLFG